jgi:hypothetical protein
MMTFSLNNVSGNMTDRMFITHEGNVGIDQPNPTKKLEVNGTIRSKEVIVETGWPDYVFANDYNLLPLSELEKYIAKHHHLPEVPSEAEVAENGVALGEMNATLLKKIEELTLHIIDQNKRIEELEKRIGSGGK